MLNGQVFSDQLFESHIFALFINTFVDGHNGIAENYKNGMEVTYSGSNVSVDTGAVLIQGRYLEEDAGTTIDAGTNDLFCKLVITINLDLVNTESVFNQGKYEIITGANDYPALTQQDIVNTNSGTYQYELARFKTGSGGITNFVDKRTFLDISGLYTSLQNQYATSIGDLTQLTTTDKSNLVGAINEVKGSIGGLTAQILLQVYPIGSIYMSTKNTNPGTLFGGTWTSWGSGRVPVGVNSSETEFNSVEKTGGSKNVTLTTSQIPSHRHQYESSGSGVWMQKSGYGQITTTSTTAANRANLSSSSVTDYTGGGDSHTNLQPYITCYMFKRTA